MIPLLLFDEVGRSVGALGLLGPADGVDDDAAVKCLEHVGKSRCAPVERAASRRCVQKEVKHEIGPCRQPSRGNPVLKQMKKIDGQ